MNEEQRRRLLTLIRELDETVPPAPNSVAIYAEDWEFAQAGLIATEGGYLRFGVEMLKAATVTPCERQEDGTFTLNPAIAPLLAPHSEVQFEWFTLTDELTKPAEAEPLPTPPWRVRLNEALWFTFLIACAVTFIVGNVTIVCFFLGMFR